MVVLQTILDFLIIVLTLGQQCIKPSLRKIIVKDAIQKSLLPKVLLNAIWLFTGFVALAGLTQALMSDPVKTEMILDKHWDICATGLTVIAVVTSIWFIICASRALIMQRYFLNAEQVLKNFPDHNGETYGSDLSEKITFIKDRVRRIYITRKLPNKDSLGALSALSDEVLGKIFNEKS